MAYEWPDWADRSHPDHLMLVLKGPSHYAQTLGQYLAGLHSREFHSLFSHCLEDLMTYFEPDSVCNILHTWLTRYNLPVDARRLDQETFAKFHEQYNGYINLMVQEKRLRKLA